MSRKLEEADQVATRFYNALVLSILGQGKQLQLWDSNVHRITTWDYELLQVPADYHN